MRQIRKQGVWRCGSRRGFACGFTLIELLIVVSIISMLVTILLPSLTTGKELARSAVCLTNLRCLGSAMGAYHADADEYFWPYMGNDPSLGPYYWWGAKTTPVNPLGSPFMASSETTLRHLWCPSLPWGSYVPQAGVSESTTTYGYNAFYLIFGEFKPDVGPKKASDVPKPADLFVFNDSGLYWAPGGVSIFQNSTYLEPVNPGSTWTPTPTSHFRHLGRTNALCADGHAESYELEGWDLASHPYDLGFVGTTNGPHYAQE